MAQLSWRIDTKSLPTLQHNPRCSDLCSRPTKAPPMLLTDAWVDTALI